MQKALDFQGSFIISVLLIGCRPTRWVLQILALPLGDGAGFRASVFPNRVGVYKPN